MPIQIICSACGAEYTVPDDKAGSTGRCRCGATIPVPPAAPASLAPPVPAPVAPPIAAAPPVAAPVAPPIAVAPAPVAAAAEPDDDWALQDDDAPIAAPVAVAAAGGPAPAAPAAAPAGALVPDEESATAANLGQRPSIQRAAYRDMPGIGYGFAIFFGVAMLFVVMAAAGGGSDETVGAAVGVVGILLLAGLVCSILGGTLQLTVSALPGKPGGALTITRKMIWIPYFQKRFRMDAGGQLVRKETASNVHVDIMMVIIVIALLGAGFIPGLLFFHTWNQARNNSSVSLTFIPPSGGNGVKLLSAVLSPGKPYPRQMQELEDMLKRVVPLRRA